MHVEVAPSQRTVISEDRLRKQYAELKHYVGRTGGNAVVMRFGLNWRKRQILLTN